MKVEFKQKHKWKKAIVKKHKHVEHVKEEDKEVDIF